MHSRLGRGLPSPGAPPRSHHAAAQLPLWSGARPHSDPAATAPGADDAVVHVEEDEEGTAGARAGLGRLQHQAAGPWAGATGGHTACAYCLAAPPARVAGRVLTLYPPYARPQPHLDLSRLKVLHGHKGCTGTVGSRAWAVRRRGLRAVRVHMQRNRPGAGQQHSPRLFPLPPTRTTTHPPTHTHTSRPSAPTHPHEPCSTDAQSAALNPGIHQRGLRPAAGITWGPAWP